MGEAIEMIHASPTATRRPSLPATQVGAEFQYTVECGNIGINVGIVAPMAFFPFSGMKNSFFGTLARARFRRRFASFTESKVVIQRWF